MTPIFMKVLSYFINKFKNYEGNDHVSLEALNNKIRLIIWLFLFIHVSTHTFFSATRLPILYYIFVYLILFGFLYLLIKCKSNFIQGIPFLILNLGTTLALMQKGENFYLRLITFSLPSLPVLFVQGYSPILVLILGGGHLLIQKQYYYYLEAFYDPLTSSYKIPALSVENTFNGWRVGMTFEIICLMTYQVVVQRLWKNYKKAKQTLEETNKKLHELNKKLAKTEELARLNQELQKALQSQDLFVACVSHELRNPLNVMMGSLDLLESHPTDNNQAQILKTSKVCGEALLGLINNLLDVAKINADKLEINECATNIGAFLETFWSYTRIILDKKGLFGHLSVDKHLPLWLNIDEHRLQQILNNLIGNAIKFTEKGSVRVKFSYVEQNDLTFPCLQLPSENKIDQERQDQTPETIKGRKESLDQNDMKEGERQSVYYSQSLRRKTSENDLLYFTPHHSTEESLKVNLSSPEDIEKKFLKIEVIDTGCGISEEAQQKLFEPFVQGDRSITRQYGGSGLGLYIVKKIVAKMGGNLKINSLKEVGTHFQVVLPVKSVEKKSVESRRMSLPINLVQKDRVNMSNHNNIQMIKTSYFPKKDLGRVLIVDDDPFNQNLLREYFKKLNFESDVANNGLEGLNIYKNNPNKYSFITMDIQMPIMDGISACKQIRMYEAEKNKKRIPIIINTGNCSEDVQKTCLDDKQIGANFFFRKPFRLSDCKLCIEKITGGNQNYGRSR